jgi:hypothetical protein
MSLNDRPWWIKESIDFLDRQLTDTFVAYEWGSGGSTPWLAQRVHSLVSLENDEGWYEFMLPYVEPFVNTILVYLSLGRGYADHIRQYPDEYFDFIEVDGPQRELCVPNAIGKLKPGGIFLLDDSQLEEYTEIVALIDAWGWMRHDFDISEYPFKRTSIWLSAN